VAVALPHDYRAEPDDSVSSLTGRRPLAGMLLAIVVAGHHVVGTVTTDDVGRLVQQSMLRAGRAPSHVD
jgi:hypothetical protein